MEEEFDLDNLYEGVPQNSDNPIDASLPEIQEEDTSCPGGACKLQLRFVQKNDTDTAVGICIYLYFTILEKGM